jgi:hypothetical protein
MMFSILRRKVARHRPRPLQAKAQFIEGRLVASFPITIFWQIELLVLVIFDAGAVLIAPAVAFPIDAVWFHKGRLSNRMPGVTPVKAVKFSDRRL